MKSITEFLGNNFEIVVLISLSVSITVVVQLIYKIKLSYYSVRKTAKDGKELFKDKIDNSLKTIKNSFIEIDKAFNEITVLTHERQTVLTSLETETKILNKKQQNLQDKIKALENVPIDALKYFEEALNKGDKRSARRDYFLFAGGIFGGALISIILKVVFKF